MTFLVAIEGIDGSGKGTQALRLKGALAAGGHCADLWSFPRYSQTLFGKGVADFLNGRFGRLEDVSPFLVSLLYAGDRFESKAALLASLATHDILVLDRYVPSNIAHQASKADSADRQELRQWIERIEYGIYGLPRPDIVVLLDIPPGVAQRLIAQKSPRTYTSRQTDIQEADGEYLNRTREVYLQLAASDPDWHVVPCCEGVELRSIEEISDQILDLVQTRWRPAG